MNLVKHLLLEKQLWTKGLFCSNSIFYIYIYCKDQFRIEPRTRMDPGPRSPNNKFVESGRKCQSKSRIKILVYSVKREELHSHRCKKYPWTCLSIGIKSNESFFFYCCLSSSFFLSFSFFVLYTLVLHHFLHPRVGQVLGVIFSCFPCLFLNLPFLTVRLLVHCSRIISTLMRPESQLCSI